MRINSDEHIEAWLALDQAIEELLAVADEFDGSTYDAAIVKEYDLPESLIGRRVADVGIPAKIGNPMIEAVEDMQKRLELVAAPSAEAMQSYLLRKLWQRTSRLEAAIERIERQ